MVRRDRCAAVSGEGRSPLLDDVLALRAIEGSRARLAEPETFRRILEGDIRTPITRVRFKASAAPPDEDG